VTANPADLTSSRDDPFGRQPIEAVVYEAPASRTALLSVTIPSFDTAQVWKLRWARDADHLPAAGDECLVVFTKQGTAWVAAWWS
jgi:hypothetical protein